MKKTQFHRDIDAIVEHAINEEEGRHVKVCGSCEEEIGPQLVEPGDAKSHTYCKRHLIAMYQEMGMGQQSPKVQEILARPDEEFAPDLRQHPELVDHSESREDYVRRKHELAAQANREASARRAGMRA